MRVASVEAICGALNGAGVRYLIAGGIAVNAHGYVRLTNDVDLVVRLDAANVLGAFRALEGIGYRPTAPVRAEEFADPIVRQEWIRDKRMQVLSLWSDQHRETGVDLFVTEPFGFDEEYDAAFIGELSPGLVVRVVRLETLIRMKEAAGRPRDVDDVQHLRWILEDRDR
ncbi:MAG: nucleotidyl transferase AbiEii/AbiGii toxin family protein [Gemmatimonadaceae bacterium]